MSIIWSWHKVQLLRAVKQLHNVMNEHYSFFLTNTTWGLFKCMVNFVILKLLQIYGKCDDMLFNNGNTCQGYLSSC